MKQYAIVAQIIVAISIIYVWVFRYDNIIKEFKQYSLNSLTRVMVGSVKIILATLIVTGIWYPALVVIPSLLMAFLMVSAQYFHFKINNPWQKHLPSLVLLILSLFIAEAYQNSFNLNTLFIIVLFSSVSFFAYGILYFTSANIKNEFKRFGLEKFGILTALLEILGAIGLIVGLFFLPILLISSGGLALLMLLGLVARLRVKDSIWVSMPALFFMLLNAYILFKSIPL